MALPHWRDGKLITSYYTSPERLHIAVNNAAIVLMSKVVATLSWLRPSP